MLSLALPSFAVFKSSNYNSKYLRCINEEGEMHQFNQFSEEQILSPHAKYEIEMAKEASEEGLVHIKCCYNNKYWTIRSWNQRQWIVAGAADGGSSDTLFKPEPVTNNNGDSSTTTEVRFRHFVSKSYVCPWISSSHPASASLYLASETPQEDQSDVFTIIDWESLVILPKVVAFKGDNGFYLTANEINGRPYLTFVSNDIGDPKIVNEVFTNGDGSVRIKSNYYGKFWRRNSDDWILVDSDDNNDPATFFWPIKVDNNVVALRNFVNNLFCKRYTDRIIVDGFRANSSSITGWAPMEVHELVISRDIFNVDFRLMDARIYNQKGLTMTSEEAVNHTKDPNTADIKLSYTKTESSTWNNSVSLKEVGVKTQIVTGIPFIVDGKIYISEEVSGAHQWGETKSSMTTIETTNRAIVPPMTKMKMTMVATQASFDVPFSYSQRETRTDGSQVTYSRDDGVYTGKDCFNFNYVTKPEKL